jgi:hypothetical protein
MIFRRAEVLANPESKRLFSSFFRVGRTIFFWAERNFEDPRSVCKKSTQAHIRFDAGSVGLC